MPIGKPMTLEQMEVTQEYIDKYPYSDEAMYLRFCSGAENIDRHRAYFIRWFENGKKPLLSMGRYRLNELVIELKQLGVHESMFTGIKTCVSEATMQRVWIGGASISHVTAEQIIRDVMQIFNLKVMSNENKD